MGNGCGAGAGCRARRFLRRGPGGLPPDNGAGHRLPMGGHRPRLAVAEGMRRATLPQLLPFFLGFFGGFFERAESERRGRGRAGRYPILKTAGREHYPRSQPRWRPGLLGEGHPGEPAEARQPLPRPAAGPQAPGKAPTAATAPSTPGGDPGALRGPPPPPFPLTPPPLFPSRGRLTWYCAAAGPMGR